VLAVAVVALVHLDAGRSSTSAPFVGDFEVNSPGWQQFDGLQYQETRPLAESFALVDAPRRQGHRAVRVTARHGYSRFGYNEATLLSWGGREQEGDEYWYAWSTFFPPDWTSPFKWGIFAEWHANLATSQIIGFDARGDRADLRLLSGLTDEPGNTAAVDRLVPLLSTLSKGRWNDFVMRVRWSVRNKGLVEVYHRVEGAQSLRKLVSFGNVPTFQVTKDGRGIGTYLLLGMYRGSYCSQPTQLGCTSPHGEQPPSVLYHDGFVRERTFDAAVTLAFPDPAPKLPPADVRPVQQEGSTLTTIKLRLARRSTGVQTDRGCRRCTAVSPAEGRLVTRIADAADDRDTAVVTYRVRQQAATVISHRLSVFARRLTGPLVVTQLRGPEQRVLAELYVGTGGTLRLSSPAGALRPRGFDVDTGIGARPGAEPRTVELRLTSSELQFGVSGRLIVRFGDLLGPRGGTRLIVRLGIDRYDGRPGEGPIRTLYDELVVGAS